jgi:hypothetical protein
MKLRDLSKKCHALVMEYFNDQDGAEVSFPSYKPSIVSF